MRHQSLTLHRATKPSNHIMNKQKAEKILFVLSSHKELGDTGKETGWYLSEAAHPWKILHEEGYEIDFVSPQGGKPPVDGYDLSDEVNNEFWNNDKYKAKIENTMTPDEVNPNDYTAIHYVGGHGTMWDFPENKQLANIASNIYENGGVVSAVCHGPAGLLNIKLSNGKNLIDGKRVAGFTNEEERAQDLQDVVPFLLEDELKERGATYEKADKWEAFVVADGRLITGQNPASATKVGEAVKKTLRTMPVMA